MSATARAFGPLRSRSDLRSLAFISLLAALLAVQWSGMLRAWPLLIASCVFAFVVCLIKHNHVHCPTFRGARWNQGFGLLLSILTASPTTGIITAHNERHHGLNNSRADFVRCSLVRFRWNWLNLLLFPFASVWAMRREKPSDLRRWRKRKPALYRQAVRERAITYALCLALLVLDWRATLLYLAIPWLCAQWALLAINLLQHQGCEAHSSHDHSRNITGRFINWLFLNNGFHTAHHMRPGLHWADLPAYHAQHVAPRVRADLNERSLAVAAYRRFLRVQP